MVMMMLMMTRRRQWELITIITGARWPDVKPRSSLDAVVIVTPATFNYIARHVTRGVAITSHVTSRGAWLLRRTTRQDGRGHYVTRHVTPGVVTTGWTSTFNYITNCCPHYSRQ